MARKDNGIDMGAVRRSQVGSVAADAVSKLQKKRDTKRLTLDLPRDMHRQLKSVCGDAEQSMRDVIIQMIDRYLQKQVQ